MSQNNFFNKKILSMLIEKACGERNLKQYASDSGISYMQLRKLWLCGQDNPPRQSLIRKLANNAQSGIEYEDFAFACGFDKKADQQPSNDKNFLLCEKLNSLSSGQIKTVEDFISFLLFRR